MSALSLGGASMNGTDGLLSTMETAAVDGVDTAQTRAPNVAVARAKHGAKEEMKAIVRVVGLGKRWGLGGEGGWAVELRSDGGVR